MVQNGYDQDDIYLTITAIEALKELGIDVNSSELGIYMYNKDFEFWNGSNNDVLKRGFKPPFSGYPKYSTSYLTGAYPDGNSYQCGASFAGYIGLDMQKVINDNCQKFAEICCYGDGIYANPLEIRVKQRVSEFKKTHKIVKVEYKWIGQKYLGKNCLGMDVWKPR